MSELERFKIAKSDFQGHLRSLLWLIFLSVMKIWKTMLNVQS